MEKIITLILYVLLIQGVIYTITRAEITRPYRTMVLSKSQFLYDLLTCVYCFGFWAGVIASIIFQSVGEITPSSYVWQMPAIVLVFFDGLIITGVQTLINRQK